MVGGKGVAGAGDCSRGHTYGMVSCSPAPYFVADAHAPFSLNILIAGIIVLLTSRDALHGLGSCASVAQNEMTAPRRLFLQLAKPNICFNPGSSNARDEPYFPMNSHPAAPRRTAPRRDSRDRHKQ